MTGKKIRVAIVDGYRLLREALCSVLAQTSDMEVVAQAENGFEALNLAKKDNLDILILEPHLAAKDGIDLIADLSLVAKALPVLVLTVDTVPQNAFRLLRAGARGWLPKTVGSAEVLQAIRALCTGSTHLPEDLRSFFVEKYLHPDPSRDPLDQLSNREFQVMRLLATGETNREIARSLFIGVKTVDTHRANLLKKLGLRNNVDLARFAIKTGNVAL